MKIKQLTTLLQTLDPESEIYIHEFDDYHITNEFTIKEGFRSEFKKSDGEENSFLFILTKEKEDDFVIPILLLTNSNNDD